jgi:hypothetical protein
MNKLVSSMIAALGCSLVFAGCSVEAVDAESEALGENAEAACANGDGATNPMLALLANAMAKELGRWDIVADFEKFRGHNNQEMLRLKSTAPCSNGCATIKQILAYQDSRLDQVFQFADGTKLSSWSFASRLATGYDVMKACVPGGWCAFEKHKLSFNSTGTGPCSSLNKFGAQKPAGGNLGTPANLRNALKFAEGNGPNPHLAFSSTANSVSIGTSLEFEPGPSNHCTEYNPTTASPRLDGAACSCPGVASPATLKRVTTNPTTPNMLYCRR